ncbi:hypothetical protein DY000_02020954 [Brassica cretica]|uniref:Uncharacterized protein n=1 Tax=Brassica cretica TaxID=69181 RepID=A0ABQ7EKP9_BRACR|nr:hypothetical protein DY000_02020954 [Brassica cretica]
MEGSPVLALMMYEASFLVYRSVKEIVKACKKGHSARLLGKKGMRLVEVLVEVLNQTKGYELGKREN